MSTRSSAPMVIQGLISTPPSVGGSHGLGLTRARVAAMAGSVSVRGSDSAIPPPTAAVVMRNCLRSSSLIALSSALRHQGRGLVDGAANLRIRAASADGGHLAIDVGVGRFGVAREQCGRGHDLACLAVAALRHLLFD